MKVTFEAIDSWLPQTQCTQCGYPRCRDYAQAIASGEADINQCPPGGEITIRGLAELLGVAAKSLNPDYGVHQPRTVAVIDEAWCIGCTLCIQACPVDAILGGAKQMHTVITSECTGCELCVPPCPVDCIELVPATRTPQSNWRWPEYTPDELSTARRRNADRLQRVAQRDRERELKRRHMELRRSDAPAHIRAEIQAAVARVQRRRQANNPPT